MSTRLLFFTTFEKSDVAVVNLSNDQNISKGGNTTENIDHIKEKCFSYSSGAKSD